MKNKRKIITEAKLSFAPLAIQNKKTRVKKSKMFKKHIYQKKLVLKQKDATTIKYELILETIIPNRNEVENTKQKQNSLRLKIYKKLLDRPHPSNTHAHTKNFLAYRMTQNEAPKPILNKPEKKEKQKQTKSKIIKNNKKL